MASPLAKAIRAHNAALREARITANRLREAVSAEVDDIVLKKTIYDWDGQTLMDWARRIDRLNRKPKATSTSPRREPRIAPKW